MTNNFLQKAWQTWAALIILILILLGLYLARFVVFSALIGIGIGVLISPLLSQMRKRFKIPRILSAFIFLLVLLIFGLFLLYGIGILAADQIQTFIRQAPELIKSLEERITALATQYSWLEQLFKGFEIKSLMTSGALEVIRVMRISFAFTSGIVIAVVIGLYTAVSSKYYHKALIRLFPENHKERAQEISSKMARTLRKWFLAQLTDMTIVGLMTLIGLWIVGIEYWAVFGLLTALLGFIPYLGILIVVVLASLVTLASDPSAVLWVFLVFIITQQVEGNFILPMVMREQIQLPEVPLLIFILLMGVWFGLVGIFIATPLFAMLRILYLELYIENSYSNELDAT